MKRNKLFIVSIAALLLASLTFLGSSFLPAEKNNPESLGGETLRLSAPDFLRASHASAESAIADRLDDEAGISAYTQVSGTINLDSIKDTFTGIEVQTADYLIGSVEIPGYNSHFNAHVYVHQDGWILAYYLKSNQIAKIVDVRGKTIDNTTLRTAIVTVASAAGVGFSDVSYYDFRYPDATNILMVAEDNLNGFTYTINIPSVYGYFERGWSTSNDNGSYIGNSFYLDNVNISYTPTWYGDNGGIAYRYGTITAAQLMPGITHTIMTNVNSQCYSVLIIIYRVP